MESFYLLLFLMAFIFNGKLGGQVSCSVVIEGFRWG